MPDMLVRLYNIPEATPVIDKLKCEGIEIRRPLPPEKHIVIDWVKREFGNGWASECEVSFSMQPVSTFIALKGTEILGFACYETTCKDFFGPTGVKETIRGLGIGKALLLASMEALHNIGYGYAIIGGAGPVDFYKKCLGATVIEDSIPGIYKGMLHEK